MKEKPAIAGSGAKLRNPHNTMSSKVIEIAKRSTQSDWWKQDWARLEAETKEIRLTISGQKAMVVGMISEAAIAQMHWAGYAVCKVEGENGFYRSLSIPLTTNLQWQGIQTILTNLGYEINLIA